MKNLLNTLFYYYKRQKWIFSYPFTFLVPDDVIYKPIFIVGHQGNGATIISRIIRRAPDVITFSGDKEYFTGADEMQSGMGLCLDYRLTGLLHKMPKSTKFGSRRGWSYACDELLPYYKFTEYDCDEKLKANIIKNLKAAILSSRTKKNIQYRFVDKSQSFAIKIPLLRTSLKNHSPKFLGIVRNPLAVCWRAAYLKTGLSVEKFSVEEKLKVAVEHWNNSVTAMFEEIKNSDFKLVRIEDLLVNINEGMKPVFDFIEIEIKEEYFPRPYDKLPFGTKRSERWYPVKTEINRKYINELPLHIKDYIIKECYENMKKLNYLE